MKNNSNHTDSPFDYPGFSDTYVHVGHQRHMRKIKRVSIIGQVLLIILALFIAFSLFGQTTKKRSASRTLKQHELRAQVKSGMVNITWMNTGSNSKFLYVLEKSPDGALFSKVGYMFSDTTGVAMLYSMLDENTFTGIAYYRLKQIQQNHTVTFSQVLRVVNLEEASDVFHSIAIGEMRPLSKQADATLAENQK